MTALQDVGVVLTLVMLEAVLSFDNAAILAVMSRRLPPGEARQRALTYGLLIAYALRVLAILLAVYLVAFPAFRLLGGAYLFFLALRHAWNRLRRRGSPHAAAPHAAHGAFGLSPLATVIVQIGFIDLAFAVDQVVAAVAFTAEYSEAGHEWKARALIIVAATIGLLFLRLAAPVLSRIMDWLPSLEDLAFVAVGFVGALLVLENPVVRPEPLFHLPGWIKIPITLSLFAVPILVKLLFGVPRGPARPAPPPRPRPPTRRLTGRRGAAVPPTEPASLGLSEKAAVPARENADGAENRR